MSKKTVYGVVGPTASGKTAVSLLLAQALGGELLCMDSMQIYRGMDIGTAKPTEAERQVAPHHLLDIVEPTEPFTVTQYVERARKVIERVPVPILVGGTGFYLRGLSLPMDFGFVEGAAEVRRRYERIAEVEGKAALHRLLRERDPISAERLHENDVRRVVRALEVQELTGRPFSSQTMPGYEDADYDFRLFAVSWPRELLYERADQRVEEMLRQGLLKEVQSLLDAGVPPEAQAMQGIGYKELIPVCRGDMDLSAAKALIQQRTRNYAKRQLTWFRADPRIVWLPADQGDTAQDIFSALNGRLRGV
ncbi:MAG: tRNA (adenosine(37)-N6)-dimethylallyltransferase MiaA [Clostridia bacterium]|nr:tRNA (adenosine(37)-N6)-dimethylallyltransferase MiaA [Clostridia bacterium]